jgi:DNA integrity scanning protein DisA with diadenylate cyclase activity
MRHATIYTTDKEFVHFLELAKSLNYVKKIETDLNSENELILENIKTGLKEMQQYKNGTLTTTRAKDFIDEL